jgi:hypothetical protein
MGELEVTLELHAPEKEPPVGPRAGLDVMEK